MGVLDESDIEKISQAFKKRNIPKLFNDPVKSYKAYDIVSTIAIAAVIVAGFMYMAFVLVTDQLTDENKSLQQQRDKIIDRSIAQTDLITNNADCPSLFAMYNEAKNNPNLDYTKQTIKDELAFRCK